MVLELKRLKGKGDVEGEKREGEEDGLAVQW